MDKDNTGLVRRPARGYEDVEEARLHRSDTTMVLHFSKIYEGYISMYLAPLPKHYMSKFTVKEAVQHKGLGAADMPKVPVSGAFKFDVGHAGRRDPARPQ